MEPLSPNTLNFVNYVLEQEAVGAKQDDIRELFLTFFARKDEYIARKKANIIREQMPPPQPKKRRVKKMTPPMTPPKDSPLIASPKMVDGHILPKPGYPDTRTEVQRQQDLKASQAFQSLYLSPDH